MLGRITQNAFLVQDKTGSSMQGTARLPKSKFTTIEGVGSAAFDGLSPQMDS